MKYENFPTWLDDFLLGLVLLFGCLLAGALVATLLDLMLGDQFIANVGFVLSAVGTFLLASFVLARR